MKIHQSSEDYLETILMINEEKGFCRCVDIAEHLHFKKSSVTLAVNKLEDEHLVVRQRGHITLTEEGLKKAKLILNRHHFFHAWLKALGIEDPVAEEEACSLEHTMSEDTFQKMKAFVENYIEL